MQDNVCFDRQLRTLSFSEHQLPVGQKQLQDEIKILESNPRASKIVTERLLSRDVELVVTRLEEDVRWLDAFEEIPTTIYNRGHVDRMLPRPRPNLRIIAQENRGREDEAMLNHIVNNYDSLANLTVFVQGWPFGHCPGLIDTLGDMLVDLFDSQKSQELQVAGAKIFNNGHTGLAPLSAAFWQYSVEDGQLGLASELLAMHQQLADNVSAVEAAQAMYLETCKIIMDGAECPKLQWVAEGAQWVVSRDRIHLRPKSLYEKVMALGEGYEKKYRGLVLEALWPVLWSGQYWDPTSASEVVFDEDPGMASLRAHAKYHCHDRRSTSEGLLWSCSEQVGVCEFNRLNGQQNTKNDKFLELRGHFQIEDESYGTKWSMLAELKPTMGGAATFAPEIGNHKYFLPRIVESASGHGRLELEADGSSPRQPLRFNITEAGSEESRRYFFKTLGPSERYLACDALSGDAVLLEEPHAWSIHFVWDGLCQLNSEGGQLTLRREDGGQLKCHTISDEMQKSSSFLIRPVKRVSLNSLSSD